MTHAEPIMHTQPKRYTNEELADIFQGIAREGLWGPWSAQPHPQGLPPSIGVYLRYSDLFPHVQGLKQVYWDALQKAPQIDAVVILSMISGLISLGVGDPSVHKLLNEKFLSKDLSDRLAVYKGGDPALSVVFNRVGCLHLMRHLLLYGSTSSAGGTAPQIQDLGELVLLANEFLHDDSLPLPSQPSDLDVAALAAPTWDVYNPRDLAYAISRMYSMLSEILPGNDAKVTKLSGAAGIAPNKILIDGIALADFLAVVFGLYSHGRKMTTDVKSALFDTGEIFKKIGPAGALVKFMSARSFTPSEFRAKLGGDGKLLQDRFVQELEGCSFMKSGLVEFRRRPLLMLDDKRAVILDLQFLVDLLTVGVYYSIFDGLPTQRRERFRELWGRMFELYVAGLLSEAYPERSGFLRTEIQFPGGEVDGLLDLGAEVLVFEIKSCLLTEQAKRAGRSDTFEADVRKKFVKNERGKPKGVGQLARSCRALLDGKIQTTLGSARIYPILLSDEPACEVPCFNSYLDGVFKSELGAISRVRPLSVMSIGEFEEVLGLVSSGQLTWPDLLETRFDHDGVRPSSVHQALYSWLRSRGIKEVRNETRRTKFEKASAQILSRFQPTGAGT
jgi:hypothetical protein